MWLALVMLLAACALTCGDEGDAASSFWDGSGDVRGSEAFAIVEERDFPDLVQKFDNIAVVEISEIIEVTRAGPWPSPLYAENELGQKLLDETAEIDADLPLATRYSAKVTGWAKGDGPGDITIMQAWGLMSDGTPVFADGTFLLEPGRTYLLFLNERNDNGDFEFIGWSRVGFDLTAGVKVLNHPDTEDIENFENMSVDEFVAYVKSLAADTSAAD